jgi:hypothetical protein
MTVGKTSALVAGFVGALALGIAIGPAVQDRLVDRSESVITSDAPAPETAKAPAPVNAPAPVRARRERPAPAARTVPPGAVETVAVDVWEPELRDRAQAVLNRGTRLEIAAQDFADAEEFMTVAHAARNTGVPFMVLKHRVVNEQQTLADAIRDSKPDLNAQAEVSRARAAARADLAG